MFTSMRTWLATRINRVLVTREEGASLVEYALLVGLIAVVCITMIAAVGTQINLQFTAVKTALGGS